jgi:hypothetical protein
MVQVRVVPLGVTQKRTSASPVTAAVYRAMPSPTMAGAAQVMVTPSSRGTALTAVGAPGAPAVGRTRIDGALGAELSVSSSPIAVTVTVYPVPLLRPTMTHSVLDAFSVSHIAPPGLAVAM